MKPHVILNTTGRMPRVPQGAEEYRIWYRTKTGDIRYGAKRSVIYPHAYLGFVGHLFPQNLTGRNNRIIGVEFC